MSRKVHPAPVRENPVQVKPGDFEPLNTKEPQISDPPAAGPQISKTTAKPTKGKARPRRSI